MRNKAEIHGGSCVKSLLVAESSFLSTGFSVKAAPLMAPAKESWLSMRFPWKWTVVGFSVTEREVEEEGEAAEIGGRRRLAGLRRKRAEGEGGLSQVTREVWG